MAKKIILLSYLFCLFTGNNLLLAASGTTENTFPNKSEIFCALPGPDSVIITSVTQNSISVAWPHVPGAARYKVTAFDLNNNVLVSTSISTANPAVPAMQTITGLLPGTSYEIGVSASACPVGEFGAPTNGYGITDNIIVGDIVIMAPCMPSGGKPIVPPAGGSAFLWMGINPNGQGDQYNQAVLVANGTSNGSNWSVQLNIASALCNGNRIKFIYQESEMSTGLEIEEHQTSGQLWFKKGNATVLKVSNIAPDGSGQNMGFLVTINSSNASGTFNTCGTTYLCADPCETNVCPPIGKNAEDARDKAQIETEDRIDETDAVSIPTETSITATPNPFNDFTNIQYQITKQSPVTMTLFNAMGQTEREIFTAENEEPGYYTRPMDVSDLAPGIYFLTIQTESGRKITTVIKQ